MGFVLRCRDQTEDEPRIPTTQSKMIAQPLVLAADVLPCGLSPRLENENPVVGIQHVPKLVSNLGSTLVTDDRPSTIQNLGPPLVRLESEDEVDVVFSRLFEFVRNDEQWHPRIYLKPTRTSRTASPCGRIMSTRCPG